MSGRAVLILVIILLIGCSGPVSFTRLTNTSYPPALKNDIEVFVGDQPPRKYIKIALISTNLRKEKFTANIDLMKRQAAELGADGIILISAQKSTLESILFSDSEIFSRILGFGEDTGYSYSAYAIKYVRQ